MPCKGSVSQKSAALTNYSADSSNDARCKIDVSTLFCPWREKRIGKPRKTIQSATAQICGNATYDPSQLMIFVSS
jgi:hypothetical protein